MAKRYCENCINPPVYYIIDEDIQDGENDDGYIGWCLECSVCRVPKCEELITHRAKYAVNQSWGKIWLCRDVCDAHIEEVYKGCCCSENSTERKILKYERVPENCNE